jgi:acetyl-CoA carboxylase beta subunit
MKWIRLDRNGRDKDWELNVAINEARFQKYRILRVMRDPTRSGGCMYALAMLAKAVLRSSSHI